MAEVVEEATYVAHHPQKIALIFSAMRHFAKELKAEGWRVRYHAFKSDSPIRSLLDFVESQQQLLPVTELVITHCGEYRLQQQIEQYWSQQLQLPVQCLNDERFFCSRSSSGTGPAATRHCVWNIFTGKCASRPVT
jgi:deoxyribodipyrimidine photolyase-related protein